ncbi:ATP-binding protein [Actinomyces sp. oral taxon 414]|uniref:ATP-binding protein n=1 Tax=Actinomyces sp. oral taxon 414 TaxID=712122 RepID=UPI0006AEA22D|nr:ATP-binding protein [Actinomyces sp. oral taxon 414]
MAVVGSGLATLAVIGSAGGVLLPGLIVAPRPVLAASVVVLVLPLPTSALALASILLARHRPEGPGGRLVERAWERLALAQVLWYTVLCIGWGLTRTLLNPAAGGATTTAPLTSLFAPVVLLAVGSLPVRRAFAWVLLLGPTQILLNAVPGALPDYRVWLTAGYYTCLALSVVGTFGWTLGRVEALDEAEAAGARQEDALAARRAAVLARRSANAFVHDDILSALIPAATGRVDGERTARAAADAIAALSDTGAAAREETPATAGEMSAALERMVASFPARIDVRTRIRGETDLPPAVARALLLAARQAVANSVRHADPTGRGVRRAILLECRDGALSIRIEDDGVGFAATAHPGRLGIADSIERRVADAGAGVEIRSAPGEGTSVVLRWKSAGRTGDEGSAGEIGKPTGRGAASGTGGAAGRPHGAASDAVFLPVMETPSARTIVLIVVAFHLGSVLLHRSDYRIAWVSPACFLLLTFCTWLLVRRWEGAMPTSAAWAVAAAIGVAGGAQLAVIVSRPMPGWDHWTAGAGTFLACGLVLRGRGRQAWAAMALMLAGTTAWVLATGGSLLVVGAYNGGHVLTLAVWGLTAMWSERAYREIGFQQRRLQSLRAQRLAEEEAERVLAEARASVARRALPVLREIASGVIDEGVRTRARLLEAELRDEIRAACFAGTAVAEAARRARSRGVDVVLLDDDGSSSSGPLEESERARLVGAVVEFLEGVECGRVVVRVPPRSRGLLVVATRDGEIALSLRRG